MLVLAREDLRNLVSMPEAIELMKLAFRELSAGRAVLPLRTVIEVEPGTSSTLMMPAYLPGLGGGARVEGAGVAGALAGRP